MQSRTHTCGELRVTDAGKRVKICGWMENVREVSAALAFVVVRDFYGTTSMSPVGMFGFLLARSRTTPSTLMVLSRVMPLKTCTISSVSATTWVVP